MSPFALCCVCEGDGETEREKYVGLFWVLFVDLVSIVWVANFSVKGYVVVGASPVVRDDLVGVVGVVIKMVA